MVTSVFAAATFCCGVREASLDDTPPQLASVTVHNATAKEQNNRFLIERPPGNLFGISRRRAGAHWSAHRPFTEGESAAKQARPSVTPDKSAPRPPRTQASR